MKALKTANIRLEPPRGMLARMRDDKRGNVIVLTAAAMLPLAGMIGGAVDMSRMYAVKSRLQSACDAGALAGRRVMGGGTWAANSNAANTQATKTFNLNFAPGAFGTIAVNSSFSEASGTVSGVASADVPMTVMRIFNKPTQTITVNCDGEMKIPNTDVMFVLDNTGSMGNPIPGDPSGQSKIDGLKDAVKCFYQLLAKRDAGATATTCGATPVNSGIGNQVQLRFGFVNYSTNVNVGKLLPNDYFANTWDYQSRVVNSDVEWRATSWGNEGGYTTGASSGSATSWGSWANTTFTGYTTVYTPRSNCNGLTPPPNQDVSQGVPSGPVYQSREDVTYPDATQTTYYNNSQPYKSFRYRYNYTSGSGGRCTLQRQSSNTWNLNTPQTTTRSVTWTSEQVVQSPAYTYQQVSTNISALKSGGSTWNNSLSLPLDVSAPVTDANGEQFARVANRTVAWDGCIEERQTIQNTDGNPSDDWTAYQYPFSDPLPSPLTSAYDLNINLIPSQARPETLWGPVLRNAVWGRVDGSSNNTLGVVTTDTDLSRNNNYYCPTESRKLQIWNDGPTFASYVDSMQPTGNTYHDIGLLWGWRFISPTGIFASENATTPGGAQIVRHIVFMTDGDTVNNIEDYTAYGAHWWDRRETNGTNSATLVSATDARTDAMCRELKDANIQVWVVSYGGGNTPATETRLQACATNPSQYFLVTSTPQLVAAFSGIAARISDLRLTN